MPENKNIKLTNKQVLDYAKMLKLPEIMQEFNKLSNVDKKRVTNIYDRTAEVPFNKINFSSLATNNSKDSAEYLSNYENGLQLGNEYPKGVNTMLEQSLDNPRDPRYVGRADGYFDKVNIKNKKFANGGEINAKAPAAGIGSLLGGLTGAGVGLIASGALTAGTGGAGIVSALPAITAGFGLGSGIGGMTGGLFGSGVNQMNKLGNQDDKQKFANGGLINFKGNTHENGGIALPDGKSEVEDGETKIGNFIFSNNLLYGKKQTFADKSKSINKKYFRDNDKIDAMGKKLELEKLSNQQENMKKSMLITDLSTKYMNGGRLKKYKDGTNKFNLSESEDRATYTRFSALKPNTDFSQNNNLDVLPGSDLSISNPTMAATGDTTSTTIPNLIENNNSKINTSNPVNTNKKFNINSLASFGNLGAQLVGDGYNVLQGLKGGDPVDFQRIQPNFVNSNPAIKAFDNTSRNSFNAARNAVRNNATSSGEYLGFMSNLANKESMSRGLGLANIKSEYDKVNTGVLNRVNEGNSGIQMAEADAQQREVDASRSAVSRGLSDIGSKIGSFNNEKSARNNQNNLITLMSSNGYKLITGKNGELSFEKDGAYVPYNVAIKSVLGDK